MWVAFILVASQLIAFTLQAPMRHGPCDECELFGPAGCTTAQYLADQNAERERRIQQAGPPGGGGLPGHGSDGSQFGIMQRGTSPRTQVTRAEPRSGAQRRQDAPSSSRAARRIQGFIHRGRRVQTPVRYQDVQNPDFDNDDYFFRSERPLSVESRFGQPDRNRMAPENPLPPTPGAGFLSPERDESEGASYLEERERSFWSRSFQDPASTVQYIQGNPAAPNRNEEVESEYHSESE